MQSVELAGANKPFKFPLTEKILVQNEVNEFTSWYRYDDDNFVQLKPMRKEIFEIIMIKARTAFLLNGRFPKQMYLNWLAT